MAKERNSKLYYLSTEHRLYDYIINNSELDNMNASLSKKYDLKSVHYQYQYITYDDIDNPNSYLFDKEEIGNMKDKRVEFTLIYEGDIDFVKDYCLEGEHVQHEYQYLETITFNTLYDIPQWENMSNTSNLGLLHPCYDFNYKIFDKYNNQLFNFGIMNADITSEDELFEFIERSQILCKL